MSQKYLHINQVDLNTEDVMGIVVHALSPKDLSSKPNTKNLVIVNAENKPMILTLWNEYAKQEGEQLANTVPTGNIVIATRVRVTTFNLLSLTTTYGSNIMINPPMAEAAALKHWCRFTLGIEDNSGLIQAVISGPEAEQLLPLTAAQMSLNKTQIETAMEVEANFEEKQITCFIRHYIPDYQGSDESGYAVVVVYINEDNIEPIMPMEETNISAHSHTLGKQV
ncbi:Unknown protein [Striga hermonthica]|uniref:Replication protein A OB domain-containing protein n=1 Tax=Striga hermonthica TaxID=68872 RepID=A0A9N7N6G2_STRHE|nr:Unknown protein [Striga hermonthica]